MSRHKKHKYEPNLVRNLKHLPYGTKYSTCGCSYCYSPKTGEKEGFLVSKSNERFNAKQKIKKELNDE